MALNTPADELHGVTSLLWFFRVLMVDTTPVQHEAAINQEANLDWTILHEVLLHVSCTLDGIGMICLGPDETLRIDTFRRTCRRLASTRRVGEASIGDDARRGEVFPSVGQHTATATMVRLVATHEVLWRQ